MAPGELGRVIGRQGRTAAAAAHAGRARRASSTASASSSTSATSRRGTCRPWTGTRWSPSAGSSGRTAIEGHVVVAPGDGFRGRAVRRRARRSTRCATARSCRSTHRASQPRARRPLGRRLRGRRRRSTTAETLRGLELRIPAEALRAARRRARTTCTTWSGARCGRVAGERVGRVDRVRSRRRRADAGRRRGRRAKCSCRSSTRSAGAWMPAASGS